LDANGILKGYFWYYGNSINLTFDLTGEIVLTPQDIYVTAD
jgi:hypothetical protein